MLRNASSQIRRCLDMLSPMCALRAPTADRTATERQRCGRTMRPTMRGGQRGCSMPGASSLPAPPSLVTARDLNRFEQPRSAPTGGGLLHGKDSAGPPRTGGVRQTATATYTADRPCFTCSGSAMPPSSRGRSACAVPALVLVGVYRVDAADEIISYGIYGGASNQRLRRPARGVGFKSPMTTKTNSSDGEKEQSTTIDSS